MGDATDTSGTCLSCELLMNDMRYAIAIGEVELDKVR